MTAQRINLRLFLINVFLLLMALLPVEAAHNITVDDADKRIVYSPDGAWKSLTNHTDRISNTSHYTSTKSATAQFSFTGAINIYYVGYGISSGNSTQMNIIFDGNTYIVDQKLPANKLAKAYLWSSGVISASATHTIKCQKTSNSGANDVNLDAFILTIPDAADTTTSRSSSSSTSSTSTETSSTTSESGTTTSSTTTSALPVWSPADAGIAEDTSSAPASSPSASSTSPAAPSTPAPSKTNIAVIVGGSLGGVAFLVVIVAVYIYFGRLKEHRDRNEYRNWYQNRYLREKSNQGTDGREGDGNDFGGDYNEAYPMTQPQAPFVIPRPSTATSGQGTLSSMSIDTQLQSHLHPQSLSPSPQYQLQPLPSSSPQLQMQPLQQMRQQTQLLTPPNQDRQFNLPSHSHSNSQSQHSYSEISHTPMSSGAMLSDLTSDMGDIEEIEDDPHGPIAPQPPPYSPRRSSHSDLPLPMASNSTVATSPLPTSNLPSSTLHHSTFQTMFLPPQPSTPSTLQQSPQ